MAKGIRTRLVEYDDTHAGGMKGTYAHVRANIGGGRKVDASVYQRHPDGTHHIHVNMMPADLNPGEISIDLTPAQLDVLVSALAAARDKAREAGILK